MRKERSTQASIIYPVLAIAFCATGYMAIVWGKQETLAVMLFFQPFLYVIASEFSRMVSSVQTESGRILTLGVLFGALNIAIIGILTLFFSVVPIETNVYLPISEPTPVVRSVYIYPTPFPSPTLPVVNPSVYCLGQCAGDPPRSTYSGGHTCIGMDNLCYRCEGYGQFVVRSGVCE